MYKFLRDIQAMAIITDRLNSQKPPTPTPDPKKQINNNKDLDVEIRKEETSFFGSFFPGKTAAANKKKGGAVMEAVSDLCFTVAHSPV